MYKNISYILLDVRANQSSRAWVPWSIDSFEKYSTFVYFTCIISSHVRIYLLFSFGCSGEPVRQCVSSLKYRFIWKIQHIRVLYMHNIISYMHMSVISHWMFGRTSPVVCELPEVWVLWKIQHIRVLYMHNIISSTQITFLFFWMFERTSPVVRELPGVWFLWKIQHIRALYMHNIISYTHISVIFLWKFGRTGPTAREFPGVQIPLKNTLFSCTLQAISSHVQKYLLFSFGCSGGPVQSCVSSLKYTFIWKIQHIRVLYMHNIISCTHITVIFLWM